MKLISKIFQTKETNEIKLQWLDWIKKPTKKYYNVKIEIRS